MYDTQFTGSKKGACAAFDQTATCDEPPTNRLKPLGEQKKGEEVTDSWGQRG